MSEINLTVNSHCCHNINTSSIFLNNSICWKVAPHREKRSGAGSAQSQWITLQFSTASWVTVKLQWEQLPIKQHWEQCRHYVNTLYLIANNITLIYPSKHLMSHWGNFIRNVVFCKNSIHQSLQCATGCTVGKGVSSITRRKESLNPYYNGCSGIRGRNVYNSTYRQLQVRLNSTRQAATKWSDVDQQRAKEWLEGEIHPVTPVKHKVIDKLFQHHEWQLRHGVGTKATSTRSIVTEKPAHITMAGGGEVYRTTNMTTIKHGENEVGLSGADIEAPT